MPYRDLKARYFGERELLQEWRHPRRPELSTFETRPDEISNDASHPDLKAALEQGNSASKKWADQIDRAIEQTGPGQQGDNKILEAHYEVSRLIRQQAPDAMSRDLGIVAAGQLALHYWIASFGTMASYLSALGMDDAASAMKASADEAKQADQQHTELAAKLLAA